MQTIIVRRTGPRQWRWSLANGYTSAMAYRTAIEALGAARMAGWGTA